METAASPPVLLALTSLEGLHLLPWRSAQTYVSLWDVLGEDTAVGIRIKKTSQDFHGFLAVYLISSLARGKNALACKYFDWIILQISSKIVQNFSLFFTVV